MIVAVRACLGVALQILLSSSVDAVADQAEGQTCDFM